jgi:hypothetical protein
MKNKLFTAFFLFTTLSALAQQPSNAELLAHLKSVKTESVAMLDYNQKAIKQILSGDMDWSQAGFDYMIRIWQDLFYALDPQDKQFDADAITCLQLLCETQDSIKNIFDVAPENGTGKILTTIGQIMTSQNKDLSNAEIKKNYEAVFSVFAKHMKYSQRKISHDYLSNAKLAQEIEDCLICGDFWCMGSITIYQTKVLEKLLPRLDAKIAEIERTL